MHKELATRTLIKLLNPQQFEIICKKINAVLHPLYRIRLSYLADVRLKSSCRKKCDLMSNRNYPLVGNPGRLCLLTIIFSELALSHYICVLLCNLVV